MKKDRFIKRNWGDISKGEKWKLADEIIKIAYIVYNSGINVAEKLEMPDEIMIIIRWRSTRASGFANDEVFINRNLDEISQQEKDYLSAAIINISRIIGSNPYAVAKKLEVPEKYILKQ